MHFLFDGIRVGLVLAVLVGPILFALVQTGVERGIRAGMMVGLGIWVSDLLFILAVYSGFSQVNRLVQWEGFTAGLGMAGSLILAAFGLGALLARPPQWGSTPDLPMAYGSLWVKGFLINTVNPFTVFFWISIMSYTVIDNGWGGPQAGLFFSGILGTIMLTDSAKVILAKSLRRWLGPGHILLLRRISGFALILFGVILLLRSLATAGL